MKTFTADELKVVLDLHKKWLNNEDGGIKADLSYSDLRDSNLSYSNLRGSNLSYSDLRDSDLRDSDLRGSDLSYSDLRDSDLRDSDLRGIDLIDSDLSGSNLRGSKTDKKYLVMSCIGSRKDSTTYCFEDDKIWCGCFAGTLAEFETIVNKTHANNPKYLKEYTGAIAYIRSLQEVTND